MNPPLEQSGPREAEACRLAWATWPADGSTPVRLYLALRERRREVALLESVEGPARLARYSFLPVDPVARFRGAPGGSTLATAAGEQRFEAGAEGALRALLRSRAAPRPPRELPPFCGGWVGWFAYEWACALEPRVPRAARERWPVPDATLDLFEELVAIDHAAQRLFVIAPCPGGAADLPRARERIDRLAADALSHPPDSGALHLSGELEPCTERARFEAGVRELREAIAQGEIFQAVLSQRFEQRFEGDPFTLYRVLRLTNPSPHMFYFESDGLTLVGSSPERLVSVRGSRVEGRPIAGTRPRGATPEEDEALAAELRSSIKERAEHDMLVDLARNDLGRVARTGTVRLAEHATLERFARVQHLVSRVECELASGRDALDALAASFPAGTVSGAPKVRAMELVAGLEPATRGPYAGAFGYLDGSGDLDMAIVIRSFVASGGVLSLQSGAGIVFDSDPEREHRETLDKARALFDAARLADSPAFRPARAALEGVRA
jgi:anthranilate synthase component 1